MLMMTIPLSLDALAGKTVQFYLTKRAVFWAAHCAILIWCSQNALCRSVSAACGHAWPAQVHLVGPNVTILTNTQCRCMYIVMLQRLALQLSTRVLMMRMGAVAVRWIPGVTPDMIGNMWYLSSNTEVASFQTGKSTSLQLGQAARLSFPPPLPCALSLPLSPPSRSNYCIMHIF